MRPQSLQSSRLSLSSNLKHGEADEPVELSEISRRRSVRWSQLSGDMGEWRSRTSRYLEESLRISEQIDTSPETGDLQDGVWKRISLLAAESIHAQGRVFDPMPGSSLDPHSALFDPREWVRALLQFLKGDPDAVPSRFLGVAFKDLDVYGWSSGAEVQPTVVNKVWSMLSPLMQVVLRVRQERRRVTILDDFQGVLEEGQTLLVLGPPGSGCSTLLKTLANETTGLEIGTRSSINYRGNRQFLFNSLISPDPDRASF